MNSLDLSSCIMAVIFCTEFWRRLYDVVFNFCWSGLWLDILSGFAWAPVCLGDCVEVGAIRYVTVTLHWFISLCCNWIIYCCIRVLCSTLVGSPASSDIQQNALTLFEEHPILLISWPSLLCLSSCLLSQCLEWYRLTTYKFTPVKRHDFNWNVTAWRLFRRRTQWIAVIKIVK